MKRLLATTFLAAAIAGPAAASTATYHVTFSGTGSYGAFGVEGYQGGTAVSGAFDITFDDTAVLLTPTTAGLVPLSFSLDDPHFSPSDLSTSFGSIAEFTYANGFLKVGNPSSFSSGSLVGTDSFYLGISGTPFGTDNSVFYSQTGYDDLLTNGVSVSITAVPLPGTLAMFGTALAGLAAFRPRRRQALPGSI